MHLYAFPNFGIPPFASPRDLHGKFSMKTSNTLHMLLHLRKWYPVKNLSPFSVLSCFPTLALLSALHITTNSGAHQTYTFKTYKSSKS